MARRIHLQFQPATRPESARVVPPASQIVQVGHHFGHNRSGSENASRQVAKPFLNKSVGGIGNIHERNHWTGIQKNGSHLRQFRSRMRAFNGWGGPTVLDESSEPTSRRIRWRRELCSVSRSINSRTISDSVFCRAAARRFSASRCFFGRRIVSVVSISAG